MVLFCDGDSRNFDPANLKAVPRSLIGTLNSGPRWSDRETLESAVALAGMRRAASDIANAPRRCGVCGREFTPDNRCGTRSRRGQRTCRECLDAGLRAPKDYGAAACPRCGREFRRASSRQVYCSPECRRASYVRRKADG